MASVNLNNDAKRVAVRVAFCALLTGLELLAAGARAQERAIEAPRTLSLRQAVSEAVLRNPSRVRAGHQVVAAGFEKEAAEWGRYPSLTVDAAPLQSGSANSASTSVRIEQPLWAGGRIDGQIDSTRALVGAAESAESEARRRLAQETAVAYVAWLYAAQRVDIARSGAEQMSGLLRYVDRRAAEGLASSADASIAAARQGSMLAQVAETRGALDQARAQLEALTTVRILNGVPVSVPAFPGKSPDAVEAAYLANSPLLLQRRAEIESARAQVEVRKGAMLPRVALRLERSTFSNPGPGVSASDSRASVVLAFSPDAGLASYSGYQAAGSRVDAALAQLDADENDTRLRARADWADLQSSTSQADQLAPQVVSLEAVSASYLRQFEAGRKSWLDVLNTVREDLEARLSLSRARLQRDQANLRLMVNSGTFWPWLESLPQ